MSPSSTINSPSRPPTSLESWAPVAGIPTPALVVDATVVRRNIARMAAYAEGHGLGVRPHVKTHKSRRMADLQRASGAIGLTVARAQEADAVSIAGDDVLLAFPPVDPLRAKRVVRLASDRTMRIAIDSPVPLEQISTMAVEAGVTVGVLVDLDVGLGRTGVASPSASLALAQAVDSTPGVQLDGIMIYPGHIWMPPPHQGEALRYVNDVLAETLDLWQRHGLEAGIVSGGATPTAYQSHLIDGLTEIRPGTYVFNDMNMVNGDFCDLADCAATIVCTVVSDAVKGQVVVDAGSKTLSSDRCIPAPASGHGFVIGYPGATITHLSEEHGQIDVTRCEGRPNVGDRLTIVPNHICPCVNLRDALWWVEPGREPELVTINARGAVT